MKCLAPLLVLLITACSGPSQPPADNAAATPATLPLVIRTAKGVQRFDVEVARTPQEQEKGLMFRKELPENSGMLFPMNPPRTASFWMKDTLIPLDVIFIRTDGTIAFIGAKTIPYSRDPVSAGIPVAAVLELAGGRAAELGITQDARVQWGGCAVPEQKITTDLNFCPAAGQ